MARFITPHEIRGLLVDSIVILTTLIIFFVVFLIITIIISKLKKVAIKKSETGLKYSADVAINAIKAEKNNIVQYDNMINLIKNEIQNCKNVLN